MIRISKYLKLIKGMKLAKKILKEQDFLKSTKEIIALSVFEMRAYGKMLPETQQKLDALINKYGK